MKPLTDSEIQTIREIAELSLTDTSRMSRDVAPYVIRMADDLLCLRRLVQDIRCEQLELPNVDPKTDLHRACLLSELRKSFVMR